MVEKEKCRIVVGYTIGNLRVAEATPERKNGYTVWKCRCSCGGEILLDTRCLQRGTVTDCGCLTSVRPGQRDLTGQRFGQLVCLKPTEDRTAAGGLIWRCRCDCGEECLAAGTQLVSGCKKSCGCLSHPPLKDYVGKRFGQLTVTKYVGKWDGMHRWKCRCDCGRETVAGQTLLQSGKTKSCGCLQASILQENMKFVAGTSITLLEQAGERLTTSNTSGYNGVYFNRRSRKWTAQIGFKGKNYYLGSFKKIEDAVEARKKAEENIYGEFLEWYYNTYVDK